MLYCLLWDGLYETHYFRLGVSLHLYRGSLADGNKCMMKYLLLLPTAILFVIEWFIGIVLALISILFSEVICIIGLRKDNNLRQPLRALFQPVDNLAIGDAEWKTEHPTYSDFDLAATYLRRNAAYGYQSLVSCPIGKNTVFGDTSIKDGNYGVSGWFFVINDKGFWQWCFIKNLGKGKCLRGDYGWSLVNASVLLTGSLQLTFLFRFYNFTKA